MRPKRARLLAALALLSLAAPVAAFQYASLPSDNLIRNAWFRSDDCQSFSSSYWSLDAGQAPWGGSDKTQDPTDLNCKGIWFGYAARFAENSAPGGGSVFHPNQDALLSQVVGPVSAQAQSLHFHFLFVAHRFNRLKAEIYGGNSASGPWTSVWIPLDKAWLNPGGASGQYKGMCAGGTSDRNCWWDLTTAAELGSLSPLTRTVSPGYPYYKIEFLGNYPNPDGSATGDVGGKITRVYFKVGSGGGATPTPTATGAPTPTPPPSATPR
jgi:hypothetical protein